eukprot:SAG22_NODE_6_length_41368_cov_49.702222_13_plen_206_part_00
MVAFRPLAQALVGSLVLVLAAGEKLTYLCPTQCPGCLPDGHSGIHFGKFAVKRVPPMCALEVKGGKASSRDEFECAGPCDDLGRMMKEHGDSAVYGTEWKQRTPAKVWSPATGTAEELQELKSAGWHDLLCEAVDFKVSDEFGAQQARAAEKVSCKALHLPCVFTVFLSKTMPFHAVLHNTQEAEAGRGQGKAGQELGAGRAGRG